MEPQKISVSVRELIEHQLLSAPAIVCGEHRGKKIQATILSDGRFLWKDQVFESPSVAAGRAITEVTGCRTAQRTYFSVNGWKFWQVQGQDGRNYPGPFCGTAAMLRPLVRASFRRWWRG